MQTDDLKAALFKFFKNKFILATLIALAWMFFFDHNSIIRRFKLTAQAAELRAHKTELIDRITADSIRIAELQQDRDLLERFAREEYLMKAANEVIFVVK